MGNGVGDHEETGPAVSIQPPIQPAPNLVLVIHWPADNVRAVPLNTKRHFRIGRDPECDIHIDHPSVSRKHASLQTQPLALTDLGSRNGTSIEGRAIRPREECALEAGRPFKVGSVVCRITTLVGETSLNRNASLPHVVLAPAMRDLYAMLDTVAPSHLTVLILGETGVGKEVFAREVHRRSSRADRPFLELNCAALPATILDGELFGHEKGAFTGAHEAKPGLFEAASGGTVFLDELGEMPLETQAKLLRVLESGEVLRLGGRKATKVDIRFISATNRDLLAMVRDGTFRQDLYFRANGITLTVPPLRERPVEIVPIAEAFLRRAAPNKSLSQTAKQSLERYGWPGNVRELRNVIERAAVLAAREDIIDAPRLHLTTVPSEQFRTHAMALPPPSPETQETSKAEGLHDELRALERTRILEALDKTGGNQTQAAKLLGMSRFVLMKRLTEHDILRPRKG